MQILLSTIRNAFPPLAIALGTWVVLWAAHKALASRLSTLAMRTETKIDDMVAEVLLSTKSFTLIGISIYVGSRWIPISNQIDGLISKSFILLLLLQGLLWTNKSISFIFINFFKKKEEANPASATSIKALTFASKTAAWAIFLLLGLDNLGVNITGLMAGLGVGGIAVALAMQNILGDIFASLSIVLDKPFEVGDFIIVGDFLGTVDHIGLKTTRVHSLSGEQIVFSNSDLLKSRIRNYKQMTERRVIFSIGVTYQTPSNKLTKIGQMIKEIINKQPETRFDRANLSRFGDFAINFEIVYYLSNPDYNEYMATQERINIDILDIFNAEKIDFAYPTQTLYLGQSGPIDDTPAHLKQNRKKFDTN